MNNFNNWNQMKQSEFTQTITEVGLESENTKLWAESCSRTNQHACFVIGGLILAMDEHILFSFQTL